MSSWGLKIGQFFFWKNRKNDEKFFSLFLFVLCSTSCIVFPRLDIMLEKPFYLSKQSIERSNHILKIMCKTIKNHEKSRKSQKYQSQYFLWKMIYNVFRIWQKLLFCHCCDDMIATVNVDLKLWQSWRRRIIVHWRKKLKNIHVWNRLVSTKMD